MKCIILAAGEGKRMRPLTLETPKPMIEILGKPLLHWIINDLPAEITELILVIGYKGEQIQKYFSAKGGSASGGGNTFEGRLITYVWQRDQLGTGHALELCRYLIKPGERFLFMVGDDLHSPAALEHLLRHKLGMLVHEHSDPRRFGVVEVDKNDKVIGFEEKPEKPKTNLVSPHVFVLDDRIFKYSMPRHQTGEYFDTDRINQLIKDHDLVVERSDFWHPIGYPHDLEKAEKILRDKYRLTASERHQTPVIILAGGKGTRMPENEKNKPKILVDIAGKPQLQWQIDELHRQGFFNIRLSLGHMAETVVEWLKESGNADITYVIENEPLGTGGGLKFAAHGINEPFLAINCDDIADVNFASLIRHSCGGVYNVITGMEIGDAREYGLLECDEYKKICSFKEKNPAAKNGVVNIGHYYLRPDIFANTPKAFSIERDIFEPLAKKGQLVLMKHAGNYWFGCGTPETLAATREYFSKSH